MQLIDTHSHLYLEDFQEDVNEVTERAKARGLSHILLPNIDSASLDSMLKLAAEYPDFYHPLPGLHPTHVKENFREELERIYTRMDITAYKAIGEIGIDLYWDKTYYSQQVEAFEFQLSLALGHDLPVVIHARDSFEEILEIVRKEKYKALKGVFHAFTGNQEQAVEITERGFYLGLGGIITFKNSHLPEIIKQIDLEHLLLETDSPFLAPVPYRGKRNESSYVWYIAERLAEINEISMQEVADQTSYNAKKLFGL
jgi:TatD DNase family protein